MPRPNLSPTNIPAQIRARADRAGLTITALAERCGMSQSRLSQIITGVKRDPYGSTLISLADGLGCKVDDLLRPIE